MSAEATDLRHLAPGTRFVRLWFPANGVYTVVNHPHGDIGVEVVTADGRRGELLAWERVVPVN